MAIYRGVGGTGDSSRGESVEGPNSTIENLTGLIGPIRTPTYIAFDKTANYIPNSGEIAWNEQEGTLDVGLNQGSVVLQIGEETLYRVHNGSGVVIDDGALVMATGTLGNSGRIVVAEYDGTSPPETIMGLATEELGIGEEGYVTHFGKVRGIRTNGGNYGETWADGDIIYASNTGGLTNVKPEAPDTKTIIAIVIRAHGSNGTLFVRVTQSSSLDSDDLVELSSLQDGDTIIYNATNGRFENGAIEGSGTVTSVDLTAGTGISVSGGPVTTTGSITVNNTLPMTYPSAGMAVSTGSAWGTSKATPTGDVVGTSDTQTLTNKTIAFGNNTLTDVASTNTTQTLTSKTINGSNNTITNVSLTTGVTGTLPVANGGTGLTAPGTSGNVLTSNGTTWTSSTPAAVYGLNDLIHVQDQKPQNTDGGNWNTSGSWITRTLNTVLTNNLSGASLASNKITLPAGTYYCQAYGTLNNINSHKARIQDTTNAVTLLVGWTGREPSGTGGNSNQQGTVEGVFTLSGTADVELQQNSSGTQATNGAGQAANRNSVVEVYSDVRIWRIA